MTVETIRAGRRCSDDPGQLCKLIMELPTPVDVPGVTVIATPGACPWPGTDRAVHCAACRESGGFTAVSLRTSERRRYDGTTCVAWQEARAERARRAACDPAKLLAQCGLMETEHGCTFKAAELDRWNMAVFEELQQWQPGSGRGFYLWGEPSRENPGGNGTGKSYVMAALTLRLCHEGTACLFCTVQEFLAALQATFRDDDGTARVMRRYCDIPVLLLDDFGKRALPASSDWAREKLLDLINYRVRARLPMVISSRLSLPEGIERYLGPDYGRDISSRLVGACALRPLGGPDRRYS